MVGASRWRRLLTETRIRSNFDHRLFIFIIWVVGNNLWRWGSRCRFTTLLFLFPLLVWIFQLFRHETTRHLDVELLLFSRCLNKEIYLMDECVGLFACLISVFCVEGIKDINICNNKMVNNVSMFLLWGVDCNLSRVYYLININKKFIQMQANINLCSRI